MKKNILLMFALLASVVMQAQVLFEEKFEGPQTKESTEAGWYEFINLQEGDTWTIENDALHIINTNDVTGAAWQRAIKFRNLPIKENTMYRVTFDLKGSNSYTDPATLEDKKCTARFALMQGGENLDCGFLFNGQEQIVDISNFQTIEENKGDNDGYYTYTARFQYGSIAEQTEWYAQKYPQKDPLPATYFLTINCYNPGEFMITNVKVEEASPYTMYHSFSALCIDFSKALDTAALNGAKYALLNKDLVKVVCDGEELEVKTFELRPDGKAYIFLVEDDEIDEDNAEVVTVSFKNDGSILCEDGTVAPDLEDLKGDFDEDGEVITDEIYCSTMIAPTVVSVDPEDGSFDLPLNINTFTVTLDKNANCSLVKASLFDKEGNEEMLKCQTEGMESVVVFTRSDDAPALTDGTYMLKVTDIYAEELLDGVEAVSVVSELNVGESSSDPTDVEKVVMTDQFDEILDKGSFSVTPWINYNDGVEQDGTSSNCRIIGGFSGAFKQGFYCGGRNSYGWATYGERPDQPFTLSAGKYLFSMSAAGWQNDDRGVKVQILNSMGDIIAETYSNLPYNVPGTNANIENPTKIELGFRLLTEDNIVIKVLPRNKDDKGEIDGWKAIIFGNVQVKYIPNTAGAAEKVALAAALADAKTCKDNNSDERYAGPAFDALAAAIEKYDGKSFTAPSVYKTAVAELEGAVKAMVEHSTLIKTYDPLVPQAVTARNNRTNTKFETTEIYAFANQVIEKYGEKEFDPESLEESIVSKKLTDDAELQVAISELNKVIIGLKTIGRTTQNELLPIQHGIAALEMLGAADEELSAEFAGALAISPALTAKTQKTVKDAMYKTLVANPDFFVATQDPETLDMVKDSVDMTAYIANPEVISTTWDEEAKNVTIPDPSSENIPGWTIADVKRGWGFSYHYPWGQPDKSYRYEAGVTSNANGMIAAWGTGFEFSQEITNLPAGVYTLCVGASERVAEHDILSYAFAQTTETDVDPVTLEEAPMVYKAMLPMLGGGTEPTCNATINYNDGSFSTSSSAIVIPGIVVKDGKLKIGVMADQVDHPFINAFSLFMTDKIEGYDYSKSDDVIKGDINGDGEVDIMDIYEVIDVMNGEFSSKCDLNNDGAVDIMDIYEIINYMNE